MPSPRYPSLYQINTRVWLTELSRTLGRAATLDDVPDGALDRLAEQGFDWIWFLSVWQTGLAGQRVSRANAEWRREFHETLPDLREEDIAGSGFAITGYTVHADLGGDPALARLRERLRRRGLRLLLDFVPNHTGTGSPLGGGPPRVLHQRHRGRSGSGSAELCLGGAQARQSPAGPRARSVLPGLARYAATELRQPGDAGSDDRRAGQDCRAVRRRSLRHGDAGAAGRVRTDLGHAVAVFLARRDRTRAEAGAELLLHGRGLLGSGMGAPASGIRLRLRQAALRPPARAARPAGARTFPRGTRLSGQARPLHGKPRRAAGGHRVPARRA